jgi:hypothetical protein
MRHVLLFMLPLLTLGCQGLQSQRETSREREAHSGAIVVTDNEEQVSDCQMVTEVLVPPPFPSLSRAFSGFTTIGNQEIKKGLRRKALKEGGDTVLRTGVKEGHVRGMVYECVGTES